MGRNAPRGTLSRISASARKETLRVSLPYSPLPGEATILSANSLWYIKTARSKGLSRSLKVIIEDMSDDDRTALFDELPAKTVKKLLARLSPEERRLANTLLNYPPDSAGHIMTPEFVDLKEDMSSSEALARIRQSAAKKETIYTLFVVDPARKLMGTVHLEDLILASVDVAVKDLMDALPVFVSTDTDQEEAAKTMSKYDLQTIPVVDREHRLVGILTFDDILDIVQDEATEDFERMAGISPVDERYMEAGVFTLTRKRFTWLLVCIVTQV
ncbi:MAG: magnesium transporter, partial [Synergistales bacterium]|nr:magnesium transporter [Synergistales bacterium]